MCVHFLITFTLELIFSIKCFIVSYIQQSGAFYAFGKTKNAGIAGDLKKHRDGTPAQLRKGEKHSDKAVG